MTTHDFITGATWRFNVLLGVTVTAVMGIALGILTAHPYGPLAAIPVLAYSLYASVWVRTVRQQIEDTTAWLTSVLGTCTVNAGVVGSTWAIDHNDHVLSVILLRFSDGASLDVCVLPKDAVRQFGIYAPWNQTEIKFGLRSKPIDRMEEIITRFYENA